MNSPQKRIFYDLTPLKPALSKLQLRSMTGSQSAAFRRSVPRIGLIKDARP